MKSLLFLVLAPMIPVSVVWTLAGFFFMVIVPNVNSAFLDIPVRHHFFGIPNELVFFLLFVPLWTVIYWLHKFYKKFDWDNDFGYLVLMVGVKKIKSDIKQSQSSINQAKEKLKCA